VLLRIEMFPANNWVALAAAVVAVLVARRIIRVISVPWVGLSPSITTSNRKRLPPGHNQT